MHTHPGDLREQEMIGMARKNPKLFNKLWEEGAYDTAKHTSHILNPFTNMLKKVFSFFRGKKK